MLHSYGRPGLEIYKIPPEELVSSQRGICWFSSGFLKEWLLTTITRDGHWQHSFWLLLTRDDLWQRKPGKINCQGMATGTVICG